MSDGVPLKLWFSVNFMDRQKGPSNFDCHSRLSLSVKALFTVDDVDVDDRIVAVQGSAVGHLMTCRMDSREVAVQYDK